MTIITPSPFASLMPVQQATRFPSPLSGLGFTFSASTSSGVHTSPITDPGTAVNNAMSSVLALGRKDTWVNATSPSTGGSKGKQKVKPPPPPPPPAPLPAIPPGMYPGTDDRASEMRIYGTLNGAVPRGFRNADDVITFVRYVNEGLPQGLPAQSKWQREIALAGPRSRAFQRLYMDVNSASLPAADAGVAMSSIRITPALAKALLTKKAPAIPIIRLPTGAVAPITAVPPAVAATSTPASATASTETAAAEKESTGMSMSTMGMIGAAIVLAGGAYYFWMKDR